MDNPTGCFKPCNIDKMWYERLCPCLRPRASQPSHKELEVPPLEFGLTWTFEDSARPREECAICLEDFVEDAPMFTLLCMHHFHETCARRWLRRSGTCPMCNVRLEQLVGDGGWPPAKSDAHGVGTRTRSPADTDNT